MSQISNAPPATSSNPPSYPTGQGAPAPITEQTTGQRSTGLSQPPRPISQDNGKAAVLASDVRLLRPTNEQNRTALEIFDAMGLSRAHIQATKIMRSNDAIVLYANNAMMHGKGGTVTSDKGKLTKGDKADEAAAIIKDYVKIKSTADSDGVDLYKPDGSGGLTKLANVTPGMVESQEFSDFIHEPSFETENQLSTPLKSILMDQRQTIQVEDHQQKRTPAGIDLLIVTNGKPNGSADNPNGEDSVSHFAGILKSETATSVERPRQANVDVYVVTDNKNVVKDYDVALKGNVHARVWDDPKATASKFGLGGLMSKKKYTAEQHALAIASHQTPKAVFDLQHSKA